MKKKVELTELKLINYRNIESATYQFNGDSMIVGENRIGKTNSLEAICWLLTDYLLDGSADITKLKPLSDTKREVSVEATFNIEGEENPVSFRKDYKEDWVKPHGQTELVMKGHKSNYYVNGIKQGTKAAYNKEVANWLGLNHVDINSKIDANRLLINPFYLGDMGETSDWTNLRSFIIELVGDVKDEDVFAKDSSLLSIKDDMKKAGGKIDQAKKGIGQSITEIKKQIIGIEGEIRAFESCESPTEEAIAIAKKGIEEHETNIANLRSSRGEDEQSRLIEKDLTSKQNKLIDLREKAMDFKNKNSKSANFEERRKVVYNENNSLIEKKSLKNSDLYANDNESSRYSSLVNKEKTKQAELISKIKQIDIKIEEAPTKVETECPFCHRPYEADDIKKATETAIEHLNKERVDLIMKGKESRKNMLIYQEKVDYYTNKHKSITDEIVELETQIEENRNKINSINLEESQSTETSVETPYDSDILLVSGEVDELKAKLDESRRAWSNGNQDNNTKIIEEQEAIAPFKKVLADKDYYDRCQIDAKASREKLSTTQRKLADQEQKFDLLTTFIRTKLEMLDNNVAKVFGGIKFQLIQENVNGGYDTICKPYIYDIDKGVSTSVTWKSGSKSEKVITGIAIIEAIKSHLDLPDLPILFDEGGEISTETFDTKLKTDSQLICVKVRDSIMTPTIMPIK